MKTDSETGERHLKKNLFCFLWPFFFSLASHTRYSYAALKPIYIKNPLRALRILSPCELIISNGMNSMSLID